MKRRKHEPVTIAIGFPYQHGLLVASDSQMSLGSKYKQYDEPKVSALKFSDGFQAIMAISGSLDAARCFQQILEEIASRSCITNDRAVANIAEVAIKETRTKLLTYINDPTTAAEERQQHLAENDFEVMIAYYFGNPRVPFIYKLALRTGIAVKGCHQYEAIGCGSDIAGYILTGGCFNKYTDEEALSLAFYAVETCKKFDQACGGPVQHIFLRASDGMPETLSKNVELIFESAVKKASEDINNLITQYIVGNVYDAYTDMLMAEKEEGDKS